MPKIEQPVNPNFMGLDTGEDVEAEIINNRHRILQTLGSWEYGKTFCVEDTNMPSRRRHVIKQLRPATRESATWKIIKERFEREVAILENLGVTHDQIPALHAYFIEPEVFYLVQDWIEGQCLTERVKTKGVFLLGHYRIVLAVDNTFEVLISSSAFTER
jgi:serine/threonine-protein kinase